MTLSRKIRKTGAGCLFAVALLGCGSAANDQGVSFTLLGFSNFTIDTQTGAVECTLDSYTNTVSIPLGDDFDNGQAQTTNRCLIVQNNMTKVAVRTERVEVSYYIPGAEEQPPSTSAPFTVYVGGTAGTDAPASGGSSGDGTGTNTPTGIITVGNRTAAPLNMVPPEIRSWLSLNRNRLPEPPFSMDLNLHVLAVTTAGDQLVSNDAFFQAQVTNDFNIDGGDTTGGDTTTTGTDTGAQTDPATSDGSSSSDDSTLVPVE